MIRLTRTYTIPGVLHLDDIPDTPIQHVFVFIYYPYHETHKLKQYQKRRRAWSLGYNGYCIACGKHRTHQVERWCRLSGFKCKVQTQ